MKTALAPFVLIPTAWPLLNSMTRRTLPLLLAYLLSLPVSCELGVGAKGYITEPGRRAIEASKGYFDFYLQPGQTVEHVIEIENTGDERGLFFVYPADGTSSPAGTLIGGQMGQTPRSSGAWLKVEKPQLELDPGGRQRIGFQLAVPLGTPVGEYFSYVFIQPEPLAEAPGQKASSGGPNLQSGMRVRSRIGMLIISYVGDTSTRHPDWKFKPQGKVIEEGRIEYRASLLNSGNVFLKPKLSWTLTGPQGNQLAGSNGLQDLGYIVSGGELQLRLPLSQGQLLARGDYQLRWTVQDARYPQLTQESSLTLSLP